MSKTKYLEGSNPVCLSIADVERDTGLGKDTLRVWERRYGFPRPERDEFGERVYEPGQVSKLRLIKRLIDQGHRPGKLMKASDDELSQLLVEHHAARTSATALTEEGEALLDMVRLHLIDELRAALAQGLMKQGLQRFVIDTVAPLNQHVGDAWLRGELAVTEEHLYTEQIQNLLRTAINAQAGHGSRPRILLTTLPEEEHGLGLLMVEAVLVTEGARCVSLGTQTPLRDIGKAAVDGDFDVVALSFSAAYPARQAGAGLAALRHDLPDTIALWAGGAGVHETLRGVDGVRILGSLPDALAALEQWRRARLHE